MQADPIDAVPSGAGPVEQGRDVQARTRRNTLLLHNHRSRSKACELVGATVTMWLHLSHLFYCQLRLQALDTLQETHADRPKGGERESPKERERLTVETGREGA